MFRVIPVLPLRSLTLLSKNDTLSSIRLLNLEGGAIWSTKFQSSAFFPLTPSAFVQNISAISFLTLRLSVNLVSPPVPGNTPNNGTSGRLTVLERSSTNRISSHARATSYPPPAQIPLTAAINFNDPELLESSKPFLVSFVNLQN